MWSPTRWLLVYRLRLWSYLGVGVALGATALAGGPVVRAVFAAVATAADLISLNQPTAWTDPT